MGRQPIAGMPSLGSGLEQVEPADARGDATQEQPQGLLRQAWLKPRPEVAAEQSTQPAGDADRPVRGNRSLGEQRQYGRQP